MSKRDKPELDESTLKKKARYEDIASFEAAEKEEKTADSGKKEDLPEGDGLTTEGKAMSEPGPPSASPEGGSDYYQQQEQQGNNDQRTSGGSPTPKSQQQDQMVVPQQQQQPPPSHVQQQQQQPQPPSAATQYAVSALAGRGVEAKLLLPNAKVGVVIGKGGAVINHIRETTKCNLDIAEPLSAGGPATPERVVTFGGDFNAVFAAFQMVLQHLSQSHASQQQPGADLMSNPSLLEAIILVPRNKTGGLIGRSGSSINRVRADSGATVKVGAPEDVVPTEPDVRKCVITGSIDQVMQAFALVVQKLEETPAGAARVPGAGVDPHSQQQQQQQQQQHQHQSSQQQQQQMGAYGQMHGSQTQAIASGNAAAMQQPLAPGTMPVQFQVPNESMGAVIGRAGATINQIRQMSGAKVDIAQSVPGMPMRLVTVTGTPEQIQMAQYLIQVKMGGGALPTNSYGLVSMAASAGAQSTHDYAALAQQQHLQQQQLDNYGQAYNQQEYQQLQQMHQMQQPGAGYPAMGGYPGTF